MYIKSIVLDGFKSYGHRTEITGWDSEFNAITGLNGTGKSNILDSICFVLGISNLSQVRAATLQDLIYKSGQAGVNKATVSITFDNRNRDQSPPGFENYEEFTISRQIVMGGKNKYLLNGINVTNKRIQDLFCSIQMNVNNPHFLIMQGRITKVLNMKAPEILSMIEEAAGTRMYEEKRRLAMKCIEQKEAKLLELNTIIEEEMAPKLEKIREERKAYMEFQLLERELQHLTKIFQAWQYVTSQRHTKNAESALEQGEAELQEMKDNIVKNQEQATQLDAEMAEMIKAADADGDSNLKAAEAKLKAKEKEEAKSSSVEKAIKDNISADEKKKKQLQKALIDDKAALKAKEDELEQIQGLFEQLKDNDARDNNAFALSQKKFEAVSAGMEINEDGVAETLQEQLIHAKGEAAQASSEIQQSTKFLNHHQKELKEKQKHSGSNTADYERDKKALEAMEKEVSSLEAQLRKLNYSKDRMTENQRLQRVLLNEVRSVRERVESFEAQNPYLNFRYRDPETNFNRRSVKGVVARLITLKDRGNSTAIETAAGGKFYNVIVDSDHTGQKLLHRGNLQNRTTFIPLNKIQGHKINPNVVKFAQDLVGKENVQSALSLITYDKGLQPAMEYVFGSVLVCKDLSIARQVTFHDRIRCRCVTLDGDVTDPSGTLSGGAMKKGTPILQQLNDIAQYEMQFKDKQNELTQIEEEIQRTSATHQQFMTLNERYELRQHELGLLRQRLQQTTHHQQQEEIQRLTQTIGELTEKIKQCKETEVTNNRRAKDIEEKLKDAKGHREKQLKDAETEMKRLKKVAEDSRRQWKQREQDYETLKLEISDLRKGLENTDGQVKGSDENIEKLNQQLQEASATLSEIRTIVAEMQKEVKAEKAAVTERNKEVQRKQHKKEQLLAQITEFELEIKKKSHDIKKLQEEFRTMKAREAEYSKKIKADSKALDEANRFSDQDGHEMEKKIRNMNEKRQKMSRTVNKKAQNTVEQDEKQYTQLLKRKAIVENDKRKIQLTIEDLDKKKRETLNLAWKQVSQDFGSIFRTLLPGSDARLEPPPHRTVLEGLEIKVSFGGVWKDSLSELSGGQRSLIALSLVLAMLLFKPAPLYILDEVDAALDLSHTQNIGTMLKAHFKQSQFIIVSLKDGMFNNANVLFRTKFVDGMSVVTRTVNQSSR